MSQVAEAPPLFIDFMTHAQLVDVMNAIGMRYKYAQAVMPLVDLQPVFGNSDKIQSVFDVDVGNDARVVMLGSFPQLARWMTKDEARELALYLLQGDLDAVQPWDATRREVLLRVLKYIPQVLQDAGVVAQLRAIHASGVADDWLGRLSDFFDGEHLGGFRRLPRHKPIIPKRKPHAAKTPKRKSAHPK